MPRTFILRALVLLAPAQLAWAAATPAYAAPAADPLRQVASAESGLRSRLATTPAHAPQLRLALARLEALRGTLAMQRHQQGGVLSADQQARAFARLEAIEHSAS